MLKIRWKEFLCQNAKELGVDWILCQVPENIRKRIVQCFNEIAVGPDNLMTQDLS